MPAEQPRVPRAREGNRGTTLAPARPACTPRAGSSGKPLRGLPTTLGPQPAAQHPGAELAIPRSLPSCRRRSRGSRRSARSAARTNDLEARRDDGHNRPRGRPPAKIPWPGHSARRAPHTRRRRPTETLDTKRHSFWSPARGERCEPRLLQIWSLCACGYGWVTANLGGLLLAGGRADRDGEGATVLLGGKGPVRDEPASQVLGGHRRVRAGAGEPIPGRPRWVRGARPPSRFGASPAHGPYAK